MVLGDLIGEFPPDARTAGAAIFRDRALAIDESSRYGFSASLRGPNPVDARVWRDEHDRLTLSCTCGRSSERPCQHLWAACLAAQERGLLLEWPRPRRVVSRHENGGQPLVIAPEPPPSRWRSALEQAKRSPRPESTPPAPTVAPLLYVVSVAETQARGELIIEVVERALKRSGELGKPRPARIDHQRLGSLSDETDRQLLPLLEGLAAMASRELHIYTEVGRFPSQLAVSPDAAALVLPRLQDTGRLLLLASADEAPRPVRYHPDPPWELVLALRREDDRQSELSGRLRRGEESIDLTAPLAITASGWALFPDSLERYRHHGVFELARWVRRERLLIPRAQETTFLESLFELPGLPPLELPPDLMWEETSAPPQLCLRIHPPSPKAASPANDRLAATLTFEYGGQVVELEDARGQVAIPGQRLVHRRDPQAEAAALATLNRLGFRHDRDRASFRSITHEIAPRKLPGALRSLVAEGWRVQADGKLYRRPGPVRLAVTSGIDWFELGATVDFEGLTAPLPTLLRALRRGENLVLLGDGSFGVLPEEWLRKYGLLAELGQVDNDAIRFERNQLGVLDALLAAEEELSTDEAFATARAELARFQGITPEAAPPAFQGTLRPYQEVGLGWLAFLRRFGLGGCLADDMGLGKTVQVLAMLAGRPRDLPSLVVVPRSLVWNWQEESARFAPSLKVVAHVGVDRDVAALAGADLVLTTYATLRRDVTLLREIEFDHVILDEAQAIKNASSESAKAARLLRGRHRLALSGTPVENHVGELWSIFEFLNPGMLGPRALQTSRPDAEELALMARALRPFILRRTKEEVAPELPPKHQETILCELEPAQRELYDELRAHYRRRLLTRVDEKGLGNSKIQVLEALLRLRQAACHPGLIDEARADEPAAKLELLLPRLEEVREGGHKALVFSQFTSFLGILRRSLDARQIPYQYLDGKSEDRQGPVKAFQEDPACGLFLLSLKVGGVGLNLTAADYVFVLDPWWNPAVEAQAVDRAHRIGQNKKVFVYRLLCRDTVEEKVAALQESKRALAESIITADNSLIRDLDRETLELLLS